MNISRVQKRSSVSFEYKQQLPEEQKNCCFQTSAEEHWKKFLNLIKKFFSLLMCLGQSRSQEYTRNVPVFEFYPKKEEVITLLQETSLKEDAQVEQDSSIDPKDVVCDDFLKKLEKFPKSDASDWIVKYWNENIFDINIWTYARRDQSFFEEVIEKHKEQKNFLITKILYPNYNFQKISELVSFLIKNSKEDILCDLCYFGLISGDQVFSYENNGMLMLTEIAVRRGWYQLFEASLIEKKILFPDNIRFYKKILSKLHTLEKTTKSQCVMLCKMQKKVVFFLSQRQELYKKWYDQIIKIAPEIFLLKNTPTKDCENYLPDRYSSYTLGENIQIMVENNAVDVFIIKLQEDPSCVLTMTIRHFQDPSKSLSLLEFLVLYKKGQDDNVAFFNALKNIVSKEIILQWMNKISLADYLSLIKFCLDFSLGKKLEFLLDFQIDFFVSLNPDLLEKNIKFLIKKNQENIIITEKSKNDMEVSLKNAYQRVKEFLESSPKNLSNPVNESPINIPLLENSKKLLLKKLSLRHASYSSPGWSLRYANKTVFQVEYWIEENDKGISFFEEVVTLYPGEAKTIILNILKENLRLDFLEKLINSLIKNKQQKLVYLFVQYRMISGNDFFDRKGFRQPLDAIAIEENWGVIIFENISVSRDLSYVVNIKKEHELYKLVNFLNKKFCITSKSKPKQSKHSRINGSSIKNQYFMLYVQCLETLMEYGEPQNSYSNSDQIDTFEKMLEYWTPYLHKCDQKEQKILEGLIHNLLKRAIKNENPKALTIILKKTWAYALSNFNQNDSNGVGCGDIIRELGSQKTDLLTILYHAIGPIEWNKLLKSIGYDQYKKIRNRFIKDNNIISLIFLLRNTPKKFFTQNVEDWHSTLCNMRKDYSLLKIDSKESGNRLSLSSDMEHEIEKIKIQLAATKKESMLPISSSNT